MRQGGGLAALQCAAQQVANAGAETRGRRRLRCSAVLAGALPRPWLMAVLGCLVGGWAAMGSLFGGWACCCPGFRCPDCSMWPCWACLGVSSLASLLRGRRWVWFHITRRELGFNSQASAY